MVSDATSHVATEADLSGTVIICEGVGKRFDDHWVLRGIDLEVRSGEVLGIIGPGGHGKSVLLKLMAGLLTPDEGRVLVEGQDLAGLAPLELARIRNDFGYLFQNYALFDFMTVADNVAFPLRRQREPAPEEEIAAAVRQRLEEVDLGHALALFPSELSGGMKKRVGLARATITHPPILLYDDPTAGLDPVTSSKIFRLVEANQRQGSARNAGRPSAAVVVSHDIDRMRVVCARWVMLSDGKVVYEGDEAGIADAAQGVRDFFFGGVAANLEDLA